jgi:hypothetical protein
MDERTTLDGHVSKVAVSALSTSGLPQSRHTPGYP